MYDIGYEDFAWLLPPGKERDDTSAPVQGAGLAFEEARNAVGASRYPRLGNGDREPAAHPHVAVRYIDEVVEHGYRLLFTAPVVSHPALVRGREITGRS